MKKERNPQLPSQGARDRFDSESRARAAVFRALAPTPVRAFPLLDGWVGEGIRVLVKLENVQPTGSFKARNALAALAELRSKGRVDHVVTASRGNHGLGLAWAGRSTGVDVSVFVPRENSPHKNRLMRGFGATVVEVGDDYDEAAAAAMDRAASRNVPMVHSTDGPGIVEGASTIFSELLSSRDDVEAIVVSVGGGSQAVGALRIVREEGVQIPVYGVQAATAPGQFESWRTGRSQVVVPSSTLADGLATATCYRATFRHLCEGLEDFVLVTEPEIEAAMGAYYWLAGQVAEGAAAAALAGLRRLAPQLAGRRVAVVLSGGNLDAHGLSRIAANSAAQS